MDARATSDLPFLLRSGGADVCFIQGLSSLFELPRLSGMTKRNEMVYREEIGRKDRVTAFHPVLLRQEYSKSKVMLAVRPGSTDDVMLLGKMAAT